MRDVEIILRVRVREQTIAFFFDCMHFAYIFSMLSRPTIIMLCVCVCIVIRVLNVTYNSVSIFDN